MQFLVDNNEALQAISSITLILGLPFAILAFVLDRRKARQNEITEIYVNLGDSYFDFVRMTLSAPDANVWEKHDNKDLTSREIGQKWALFEALVSLFERAYIFSYDAGKTGDNARNWRPWETFMREWCAREDFSEWLPDLVADEDPAFAAYILDLCKIVQAAPRRSPLSSRRSTD
ncbi:MAG: hypothetical protein WBA73_18760 [Devosia sp.]